LRVIQGFYETHTKGQTNKLVGSADGTGAKANNAGLHATLLRYNQALAGKRVANNRNALIALGPEPSDIKPVPCWLTKSTSLRAM